MREALLDPSALHFDAAKAALLLGLETGERVLLCEENLSGYIHNGGLAGCLSKDVAYRLKAVLPDADIIIFVRAQPAMIAACYNQYVKGGGTFSVNRYLFHKRYLKGALGEIAKAPRFSFDHFDYDKLIDHYVSIFGRDRVHVFAFEQLREDPAGLLAGMRDRLALDFDMDAVSVASVYRSYNRLALIASRALGLFTARTVIDKYYVLNIPYWYVGMRAIGEALSAIRIFRSPSARALLGDKIIGQIETRFAESNHRLMRQTDIPLQRYGYPLPEDATAAPSERIK